MEDSVVRCDLPESDIRVRQVAAVLALGLGIEVMAEILLLVNVLVHLRGGDRDMVLLVL